MISCRPITISATYVLALSAIAWGQQSQPASRPAAQTQPVMKFKAGEEARFDLPKSKRAAVLYVPKDYKADRDWPLIVNYPFFGGTASTSPFKQITGGTGFVILGMNYATKEYGQTLKLDFLPAEKEQFTEAMELVSRSVRIDPRKVFMGGVSQGGYSTTILGEAMLDRLAGLCILCAGRSYVEKLPPDSKVITGKPIFIGTGQKDTVHYPRATKAAKTYEKWGAKVTLEEWPDCGHDVDFKKTGLLDWLIANTKDEPTTNKGNAAAEVGAPGKGP